MSGETVPLRSSIEGLPRCESCTILLSPTATKIPPSPHVPTFVQVDILLSLIFINISTVTERSTSLCSNYRIFSVSFVIPKVSPAPCWKILWEILFLGWNKTRKMLYLSEIFTMIKKQIYIKRYCYYSIWKMVNFASCATEVQYKATPG
jgi:hypothetical protein